MTAPPGRLGHDVKELSAFDRDRPLSAHCGSGCGRNYCRNTTRHHRVKGGAEASGRVCERGPACHILQAEGGAWDWSQESRLVIPVENPNDQALTLQLRVNDPKRRLTGQAAIAPRSSGNLAISISAPHGALLSALRVVTEKHQRECAMADLPPLPELRFAEVSATSRLRYVGDRFCYMEAGKTASSLPLERSQPT